MIKSRHRNIRINLNYNIWKWQHKFCYMNEITGAWTEITGTQKSHWSMRPSILSQLHMWKTFKESSDGKLSAILHFHTVNFLEAFQCIFYFLSNNMLWGLNHFHPTKKNQSNVNWLKSLSHNCSSEGSHCRTVTLELHVWIIFLLIFKPIWRPHSSLEQN